MTLNYDNSPHLIVMTFYYNTMQTPFSIGLRLLIHKKTKSKDIINVLANLNLSVN